MHGSPAARLLNELDTEVRTPVPVNHLKPPTYGQAQRQAIDSVVDSLTNDLCQRIRSLRTQLDDIEQLVLESSAKSKQGLADQVVLCIRLSDEVTRTQDIVADLRDLANQQR